MSLIEVGIGPAIELVKTIIRKTSSSRSERKRKQLISTAIMELLKLDPDYDAADAAIAAAEATGIKPDPDLFRAKSMALKAKTYGRVAKKAKKCAKKAVKKVTKKKAAKKVVKKGKK